MYPCRLCPALLVVPCNDFDSSDADVPSKAIKASSVAVGFNSRHTSALFGAPPIPTTSVPAST